MERLVNWYPRSRHDVDGMVFAWTKLAAADPWHCAERFGGDPMIGVIRAILDVALDPDAGADSHERLVRTAAAHGDQRRLQGVEEGRVLREYQALAIAVWDRLHKVGSIDEGLSAVIRLSLVLRLAISAATAGYHRSDRAPLPSWSTHLEEQIAACSTSMATLFPHADAEPAPAHSNGHGAGAHAGHSQENGHAPHARLGNVTDLLVDSFAEGPLANRAASLPLLE